MLITISEALGAPVSTLLGETVTVPEADNLKAISERLEVINLQLAREKTVRGKILHWLFISVCVASVMVLILLLFLNSPYLGWNYNNPQTAVLGTAFHVFEWLFVRLAPVTFIASLVGAILTGRYINS